MDAFHPTHILLHDYGQMPAHVGPGMFNPYHSLVLPDGSVLHHNGDADPFGRQAPHAYEFNPHAVGIAWGGPVGSVPTPEARQSINSEIAKAQAKHNIPGQNILTHGEAYEATKGTPQQASRDGRGLDEAHWWHMPQNAAVASNTPPAVAPQATPPAQIADATPTPPASDFKPLPVPTNEFPGQHLRLRRGPDNPGPDPPASDFRPLPTEDIPIEGGQPRHVAPFAPHADAAEPAQPTPGHKGGTPEGKKSVDDMMASLPKPPNTGPPVDVPPGKPANPFASPHDNSQQYGGAAHTAALQRSQYVTGDYSQNQPLIGQQDPFASRYSPFIAGAA